MVLQLPTFWVGAPAFQNIHCFPLQQPCCWSTGEERMRSSVGGKEHLARCPTSNATALSPHHSLQHKGLQYAWRMQLLVSQRFLSRQITQVEFVISKVKIFPTDLIILRCYQLPWIFKGIIMWLLVCCLFLLPVVNGRKTGQVMVWVPILALPFFAEQPSCGCQVTSTLRASVSSFAKEV